MKHLNQLLVLAAILVSALALSACGNSKSANNYEPKTLRVQLVPSSQASTLVAKAKPLEKMLSSRLHMPVKLTMSTDYNTLVEAMKSKQVDVGFLPADAYVLAHKQKAADILLQSMKKKIGKDGVQLNEIVPSYRSEILVKKNSGIKSWKDLKGKTIAVQNATSSSGYIFPIAELKEKGLDLTKKGNAKLVTVLGHDQGVINVLNGTTDAAFVFEDARNLVKKEDPNIMKKVVPIYYTTGRIPNDTVSVRHDMSQAYRNKLIKAFKSIAKTKEGKYIMQNVLYSTADWRKGSEADFNIVRKYAKIAGEQ
ncbi:MAG: phosphate/phosphite/phosphonate ABC transporter substrate-binding protein [Lactobacillus sp.]|nr:phosphate/phosphite/phosphonate ABC transporter substrate-binding protein [Lactobacillus sp.]